MSYMKQYGTSAKGNDRLLKEYGGSSGSSPMARQRYATGGAVKTGNPSLSEGLSAAGADGAPAKPSLARPGRKAPGKKGGKTNVNVIVMPTKGDGPPGPGGPPPPMPPMGPPPGAGPMPPPGPGGPPMPPMRKSGGRVEAFKKGGRVKKDTGGWVTTTKPAQPDKPKSEPAPRPSQDTSKPKPDTKVPPILGIGFKKGGRACKKEGGPAISGFNAGAGGAKGRLEKIKKYGK